MDFSILKQVMDGLPALGIPQAEVAVTLDDKLLCRYGVGIDGPPAPDALYNLYSVTKVITAVAAAQLLERGSILLTDYVYDYLPGFKNLQVRRQAEDGSFYFVPSERNATVRHLFCMGAGCNYDFGNPAIKQAVEETDGRAPTMAIAEALGRGPIYFQPGDRWSYSLCIDLLGALVEAVSGMRFADYVKKNIFEPLDMHDSCFHQEDCDLSRMARQYEALPENGWREIGLENRFVFGPEFDSGGAGGISTLSDMQKFAAALARGGLGCNGARILSDRTVSIINSPHHLTEKGAKSFAEGRSADLIGYSYGLGVRTLVDPGEAGALSSVGEFGWSGAAGAYIAADPASRLSIYYASHILGRGVNLHPRIRNAAYASVFR